MINQNYTTPQNITPVQLHELTLLTKLEQTILRHIIYYASKSWGFCRKTYQTIADEVGCCRDSVKALTKKIKPLGMSVEHRGSAAPLIRISDKLKHAFLSLFTFRYPANTPQNDDTIYINENTHTVENSEVNKQDKAKEPTMIGRVFDKMGVKKMRTTRLPREVLQQIIKNFNSEDSTEVEKVLSRIGGSTAHKINVIEAVVSARASISERGETIESIGAFVNHKHKQLLEEESGGLVEKEKSFYGYSRSTLDSHARVGESYRDVANRLSGKTKDMASKKQSVWSGGTQAHVRPNRRAEVETKKIIEERDSPGSEPPAGFFEKMKSILAK